MAKLTIVTLLLILTFGLHSAHSADEGGFPKIGFVKSDGANIRAGDNVNFESLCKLEKLDPVKILEKRYSWFKIALPKRAFVYISKEYVVLAEEEARTGWVNASRVNLRAGPDTKYSILGQVSEPEEVRIISEQDEWYKIIPPDGTEGWIHESQVTFTMEIPE